jgi:integrase
MLTTSFNSGVSIEVVRRRLGHASTETTQVYTLLADQVADTEIRTARRKRETRRRLPASRLGIKPASNRHAGEP